MNALATLVAPFAALGHYVFGRLTLCAQAGAFFGMVVGILFSILQLEFPGTRFPLTDVWRIALITGVFALAAFLLFTGVWMRLGVSALFLPALVNAALTSLLTVYLANLVNRAPLSPLIGLLVGLLVGMLLCAMCARRTVDSTQKTHA